MSSVFELWIHSIKQFYHIPANSLFITKEIPKDFLDTVIQTREMLRDLRKRKKKRYEPPKECFLTFLKSSCKWLLEHIIQTQKTIMYLLKIIRD